MCMTAFRQVPVMALFAKLTPFHVEASVFSFLTGVYNFQATIIAPYIGALFNRLFAHATIDDLTNFKWLALSQALLILLPVLFVWLVPLRSEIQREQ
mmetsp:Transcript_18988/g.13781  ORF Transcript_18988/g.13781 Transcript_18988/m.13781 type:complete len:97 (-) Transcript_18988:142-432(-)